MLGAYRYTIATAAVSTMKTAGQRISCTAANAWSPNPICAASCWVSIAPPTIVTNEAITPTAASSVNPTATAYRSRNGRCSGTS